jgi:hypothetical protein
MFFVFRFWVMHHGADWLVHREAEGEHFEAHIVDIFIYCVLGFTILSWFFGVVLLFVDGYRRRVTGCLLILLGIVAVPLLLFLMLLAFRLLLTLGPN